MVVALGVHLSPFKRNQVHAENTCIWSSYECICVMNIEILKIIIPVYKYIMKQQ